MPMKSRYFSLNFLTLALFPLCSYAVSPWSVSDGSTRQVTKSYSSSEEDDFPLSASGTGSTLVTDPGLTFTTVNDGTFTAKLRDGANLELNEATLTTAGGSANGVDMQNSTLTINTGSFTVTGSNSAAVMATNSNLTLNNVSMQLKGSLAQGIRLAGGLLKASELTLSATEKTNRVISLFSVTGTLDDVNITQHAATSDNALFLDSSTLAASNVTIDAANTTKAAIKVGNGIGNENTTKSSLTLEESTIKTGFVGLRAMNGDMTLTNVNVYTRLPSGHALDINSQSDTIINGGSYATEGAEAAGANLANTTTTLNAKNSRFTTSGSNAYAIQVQAGTATLTDSVLTTSGDVGLGIYSSGNVIGNDVAITTSGTKAYGAFTAASGQLTLTDSTVSTSGDNGHGIYSKGNAGGNNLTVTTSGTEAYGVYASEGGQLTLTDSTITTTGITGYGIAAKNGTLTVSGTDIETSASDARGAYILKSSSLDLKNSTITTSGELAHGLYAESGSTATLANSALSTAGDYAYGMVLASSTVASSNDTVSTQGEGSAGIYAAASTTLTASNLTLNTRGEKAHAVITSLSTLDLTDSSVTTTGKALALQVLDSADNKQSTVTLNNVALRSEASTGVSVEGATLNLGLSNGTLIYGGDGVALSLQAKTSSEGAITYSQAEVTADNNVTLLGDVNADSYDSTLNLSLTNGSTLNGATQNVNQLILDATSSWLITDSSNVKNLLQNKGTVIFTGDSGFSTLTIDGDLTGSGQFVLNTQLGDDTSATDRIQVNGSASGNYILTVNNRGGLGASTSAGILLVDVAGDAQAATFNLRNNSVVAGSYEYFLNNINDNSWYLQASYTPVNPVTPVDPAEPAHVEPPEAVVPVVPGPKTYRSETAGYLIAPYLNSAYGFASIGNWHERVGAAQKDRTAWGRVYGRHDNYEAGRFAFNVNTAFVQLGGDLLKKDLAQSWHVTAGPMMTLGHQTSNNKDTARSARPGLSVDVGKIETNAYGIGGYLTFWDDSGAYLDNVVQLTRYSNNFSSQTNAKMDSYATVLSMEVGKPVTLMDKLRLEPQLQAMGQYMNISQTYSSGVKLKDQNLMMAQLREGLRLVYDGVNIKPYVQGDVVQMLGHTPGIDMNNETLRPDVRRGFWQASAGVSASVNPHFSVYSQLKYAHSFGPGSEGYTGNLGVKYQF